MQPEQEKLTGTFISYVLDWCTKGKSFNNVQFSNCNTDILLEGWDEKLFALRKLLIKYKRYQIDNEHLNKNLRN